MSARACRLRALLYPFHFVLAVFILTIGCALSRAQTFTVIGTFPTLTDPLSALVQDRDGTLIGTTEFGGSEQGTIFDVTLGGTITNLYTFLNYNGGIPDPEGLLLASNGQYYGTTYMDGTANAGSIYSMTRSGSLNVLYSFPSAAFGGPDGPLVEGPDGNYYGVNYSGCAFRGGCIFSISPQGLFYTLFNFSAGQGAYPEGALSVGADGNFYGTTSEQSDVSGNLINRGTVFRLVPDGSIKYLYNFGLNNQPTTGVTFGADGNLYGTLSVSTNPDGLVFRITPEGQYSVLHYFSGADGISPKTALVLASDGNIYGTTYSGGANGYGTVFRVDTAGNFTTVYNFEFTQTLTNNALMQDTNGLFYGGLSSIEPYGDSAIFSLDLGLPPFVKIVQPWGKAGSVAEILGQGFSGATSVMFNGVPADVFTVESDTFLVARVPEGASTGVVTVVTTSGTVGSIQKFAVR